MSDKLKWEKIKKPLLGVLSLLALAAFWGVLFVLVGQPMLDMVDDPAAFRDWVQAKGIGGKLLFIGFMILQVLVSVIPSEPLEIGAGYAFGAIEGTVLCLLGIAIGTAMIFFFSRRVGSKVLELFFSRSQIERYSFLHSETRLRRATFLLYFIPGLPKDMITWILSLTSIRFLDFILISSVARIFSIVTSTVGGSALGEENYGGAIIAFVVTALVSGAGYLFYRLAQHRAAKKQSAEEDKQ